MVAQGLDAEPEYVELLKELLRLNSDLPLGAFSVVDKDIFFSHSFLGRTLIGEQLIASLNSVATISDEYDEKLVARYGGETALDHIRSDEQRQRAAARKAAEN